MGISATHWTHHVPHRSRNTTCPFVDARCCVSPFNVRYTRSLAGSLRICRCGGCIRAAILRWTILKPTRVAAAPRIASTIRPTKMRFTSLPNSRSAWTGIDTAFAPLRARGHLRTLTQDLRPGLLSVVPLGLGTFDFPLQCMRRISVDAQQRRSRTAGRLSLRARGRPRHRIKCRNS